MTRHSPYNYAFNNPLRFIDPDGRNNSDFGDFINSWTAGVNTANAGNNTPPEDPGRKLIRNTSSTDIKVTFNPEKHSTDGPETVTMQNQSNSRYVQTDTNGNESLIYTQTIYTHQATVDVDGNISNVSETVSYVEQNADGKTLKKSTRTDQYNINDAKASSAPLKDFASTVKAVSQHRLSEGKSGAQDYLEKLNKGNTNAGLVGTILGFTKAGWAGTIIGVGTTAITYTALNNTEPKDVIINVKHQMKIKYK